MLSTTRPSRRSRALRSRLGPAAVAGIAAALAVTGTASAYNAVPAANGDSWGVHDAHMPGLDTGSVRDTPVSGALRGFGGIQVRVTGALADDPSMRLNGHLMRGFGLRYDGHSTFRTTTAVNLGGVSIERTIYVERTANWARWFDQFTNTLNRPVTVEVVFGGATGYDTGNNRSRVIETSDGDPLIEPGDTWSLVASQVAAQGNRSAQGPSGVVIGEASGGLLKATNWLYRAFDNGIATTGHEANFQGYSNRIILQPGETKSLVHFVVIGLREATAGDAGTQVDLVRTQLEDLAANPDFTGLTVPQLCTLENWTASGVDCSGITPQEPEATPNIRQPTTTSKYNVVGKTITEMQADMEAGRTTSQEITRAYLDRIAAYDVGQFGHHSFTFIAKDAMAQAKRADERRARGEKGDLLGIPVALKDLYDTKDMPTTNGSWAFDGFIPKEDAFQVRRLREAGAVIIGKATMAEYANSGHYSDSAWGQVWNAYNPSKSSIGSSGGSAVATALSLTGFALGSQTGDSLWGPSSAASLVSLRGTDGMQSLSGVMPLTWLNDYAGAITRSIPDLARALNVLSGTDPDDPLTKDADKHRPADWKTTLDPDALKGKVIGYIPERFVDPFGTTGTSEAMLDALKYFEEAGATLKPISPEPPAPPSPSGDRGYHGWQEWLDDHPEAPYSSPVEIITSQKRLPYSRRASYTGSGALTPSEVAAWKEYKAEYKRRIKEWMDTEGVDAVAYAGLLSDVLMNDGPNPSFGRVDPPHSAAGIPAMIFPAGVNDHGEPINLQLIGRAWDDPKLMGYAYAYDLRAKGTQVPDTAPPLKYDPAGEPAPIVIEKPAPPISPSPVPDPPSNEAPAPAPAPMVRTAVRLAPAFTATRAGRKVAVRVRLSVPKALAGKRVLVQRRVKAGSRVRVVNVARLKVNGAGRVNSVVRLSPAAAYRLRTKVGATATTKAAVSAFKLVKVPAAR